MNFLGSMLGGLVDKEKAVKETIMNAIEDAAEELTLPTTQLFFMIKPIDDEKNFKVYLYRSLPNETPIFVREVTIKELVGE